MLCGTTGSCLLLKTLFHVQLPQADQLSAASCLELLTQLETGVSEHDQLRALGARLLAAACQRLSKLLGEDAAVRGDAAVQAQLLAFLGPLHHMLNDTVRQDLFIKLPFEVLRVRTCQCTALAFHPLACWLASILMLSCSAAGLHF